MKKLYVILITALLMLTIIQIPQFKIENVKASGTTYYVSDSDGDDNDDGLSEANAWASIGEVNNQTNGGVVNAGDTILFKRGDTFFNAQLTIYLNGVDDDNRFTIGAYGDGVKPIFDRNSGAYGIYIDGKNNVTIENISIYDADVAIDLAENTAVQNITIQHCCMNDSTGAYGTIYVAAGATHLRILDNYMNNGLGDIIRLAASTYVLVEGNTLIGGASNTHSVFMDRGSDYFIIRDNVMSDGSDDVAQAHFHPTYGLIEDNTFYTGTVSGFKMNAGYRIILRHNVVYDTDLYGMGGYGTGDSGIDLSYCKWYHNTIYNVGSGNSQDTGFFFYIQAASNDEIHNNVIKNNIFCSVNRYGIYSHTQSDDKPEDIHDNIWDNNIIYDYTDHILFKDAAEYTLSEAENLTDGYDNVFSENKETNPLFEAQNSGNFHLNSTSPAIDTGNYLTTVTSGSSPGTSVQVADAGYFCDGFGLIDADEIVIGTDNVTITDVNYDTNTITFTPIINFVNGEGVSLRYNGSAPDIGAFEYPAGSGGAGGFDTDASGYPDGYFYFEVVDPQYYIVVCYDETWHYFDFNPDD